MKKYRAVTDCRAGGVFRRAGEVFEMAQLPATPPFLEEVKEKAAPPTEEPGKKDDFGSPHGGVAGAGKEELGLGEPVSADKVTSADMVKMGKK